MQIRRARTTDAPVIAALLSELGYPATAAEAEDRPGSLNSSDCVLITTAVGFEDSVERSVRLPEVARQLLTVNCWTAAVPHRVRITSPTMHSADSATLLCRGRDAP